MGWYLGQRTFPLSSDVQFLRALDFKEIALWGVKQVGMGLVTHLHWSHGYFSVAVETSPCALVSHSDTSNGCTGIFLCQQTVQIDTKNHLQNFHVGTSKSHSVHLWAHGHAHTHTNTFKAHTKIMKIDFSLQCNGNIHEPCKRLNQPGSVAQSLLVS